jgi:drug/metabolite transporter (DMT)-like permease
MTNRPLLLLLGTGAALGCNFPLGKLAAAQGINPALWAAVISGGAGLIMLLVSRLAEGPSTAAPVLRFSLVSGFISYVVPNFLTFAAIPHLGSGLVAVMFALSPVVTALLSIVLKVRPPSMLGLAGIGVGLVGAIAIIVARNSGLDGGQSAWLLLAALVPVSLGLGNVYRTLAWPRGAGPIRLAALTNLAAVGPLLALAWALDGLDLPALLAVPGLVSLQLLASSLMFLMFFRLQQEGGPTYLSQIGYVAAAVGAGIGVGVLGESYPAGVWAGVAIVAAGIGLTTLAQLRTARA